jgi:hypothetical protein
MMRLTKTFLMSGAIFLLAALFFTASTFTTSLALAQGGTRVYLQPVEGPEGGLTVEVMAENVTDLYGAEFRLKYDPAVLAVQDDQPDQEGIQVAAGTLLPADQGFVVANQADPAEGTITFAMTLLNPAPPASGSGPLARITFEVLQDVPSTISVEKAKLVAVDLQTITSEAVALDIGGGEVDNSQPQPQAEVETAAAPVVAPTTAPAATTEASAPAPAQTEREFPWWMVAVGMILLGLIGLGVFAIMGGMGKPQRATQPQTRPQPAPQPLQQPPYPQPPQPGQKTRTRPSAFK